MPIGKHELPPLVLWIAPRELLSQLGIKISPEIREVFRELKRAHVGTEDFQQYFLASAGDCGSLFQAVEVLNLRPTARRGIRIIMNLHAPAARQLNSFRGHFLDELLIFPGEGAP